MTHFAVDQIVQEEVGVPDAGGPDSMTSVMPPLSAPALLELLQRVPVGIACHGDDGRILWGNRALESLLAQPLDDLLGLQLEELPLVRSEHPVGYGSLCRITTREGAPVEWLAVRTETLPGSGKTTVSFFLDASEAERARIQIDRLHQALRGQVSTDPVTGLLSPTAVLNQLEAQVSRSRRYQNPLSVLLMRLGCQGATEAGPSADDVLTASRMLRDQTRWPDIIGRWSDHEFLLVLPETSAVAAGVLAQKLRERLAEMHAEAEARERRCSVHFGIAEWIVGRDALGLVRAAADAVAMA